MDDPRKILAEAGVECAELDAWDAEQESFDVYDASTEWMRAGDAAILALSRLAAKYKAEADTAYETGHRDGESRGYADFDAALDGIVADGFDVTPDSVAGLIAKFKWQRDEALVEYEFAASEFMVSHETVRTGTEYYIPHMAEMVELLDRRWDEHLGDTFGDKLTASEDSSGSS